MTRLKSLFGLALAGVTLLFSACGGGGGGADPGEGPFTGSGVGTMQLSLTDAPACGYESVKVTVRAVRVHASAEAVDGDSGWQELTPVSSVQVDLLHLTNGDLLDLGRLTLPAGTYTQMRLLLTDGGNTVTPTGGAETALKTPSAQQSGLKIPVKVVVPEGQVAHVVIDFDACKSVVKAGKSGQYLLKPVLSAIVVLQEAGQRVEGCVAKTLPLPATSVSLQAGGVPVRATVPKDDGCFALYPVPVGSYALVVAAPGHVTAVMTDVPVTTGAPTIVSTPQLRIDPPLSLVNYAVQGTVTPADASVRALQTLTGGPTVEVAWLPVDSSDGSFGNVLPADAPVRTSYLMINPLVSPGTLGFLVDAPVAGAYTVEAARPGSTPQSQAIDISAGPVTGLALAVN